MPAQVASRGPFDRHDTRRPGPLQPPASRSHFLTSRRLNRCSSSAWSRKPAATLAGLVAAFFAAWLGAPPAHAQEIGNPDLFEKSLAAAAEATEHYGLVDDPVVVERVNRIGYRLAQRAEFPKFPFTFAVVDMPIPNAFALPAGQIFVTRGMLALDLDDDMLAALLGHEIAHVTKEHFLKMRKRATLLTVLSQIATIGAAVAASGSRGDVYQGPGGYLYRDSNSAAILQATQATGAVIGELLLRSYSRDNEDESDEQGQRLAALAGFDPDGTRRLMTKMRAMIPQTKAFGYWQTHPFFDERVLAAEARREGMVAQEPVADAAVDAYRTKTQEVLLGFLDSQPKLSPESIATVKASALVAWPRGTASDNLRLERLHGVRDRELERLALSRDYGSVLEKYSDEMAAVSLLSPESPLLTTLSQEMGELRTAAAELYPQAEAVLDGEVYEIPFLEAFASNYPDSKRSTEVALDLGLAYSRLSKESEAVKQFLLVWESPTAGDLATTAQRGLHNLAPVLTRLAALEQLATQDRDPALGETAAVRLDAMASKFTDIANGAEYLARFPEGRYVETVSHRLDTLADTLYKEMVLFQELGDSAKAIERANLILEHAPLSPAADRLSRQLDPDKPSGKSGS